MVGSAPPRPQPVGPSAREAAQLRRSPPATGLARRARASGPGFATPPSEAHPRGSAPPPPALRPDSSVTSQPPLYCKPSFSARIKSFARNDFAPKIWICSLCFFSNHFRVPTSPPSSSSSAPPLIASLVASRLRRPQSHCGRPSRSSPNELRNYNWYVPSAYFPSPISSLSLLPVNASAHSSSDQGSIQGPSSDLFCSVPNAQTARATGTAMVLEGVWIELS